MRFWLLKRIAQWMGLTVCAVGFRDALPDDVAVRTLTLAQRCERESAKSRSVRCVVLATDPLVAVEMMHHIANHDFEVEDGRVH